MIPPPEPNDEKKRVAALHALGLLDTPPEERFDRITRLAQRTFSVPIVLISLIDEKRQWFKSRQGLEAAETPRELSFCAHAIADGGLMVVPDATKDARFADNPLVAGDPLIRFYAGQPIEGPDGSLLGTLCLIDRVPRELDLEQRRALRDLAGMVQEQIASSPPAAEPEDEHARIIAQLRASPEQKAATRRIKALGITIAVALLLVTGISMNLALRLVADSDRVEAIEAAENVPPPSGTEVAALARMKSTARFFRLAVGVRSVIALAFLAFAYAFFTRLLDARLTAQAAVELERARLRAVIDSLDDGVVIADARGRFLRFNPAAERILGAGMTDGGPESWSGAYGVYLSDGVTPCPSNRHPLTRACAGETVRDETLFIRNAQRPGGVRLLASAVPLRSAEGVVTGAVVVFRDEEAS